MEWLKKLRQENRGDVHSTLPKTSSEAEAALSLPLLEEADGNHAGQPKSGDKTLHTFRLTLFNVVIFILSLLFYLFRSYNAATDAACERRMWPASPERGIMGFEQRQYDSDVVPREYFGLPTAERRVAWDRLWQTGYFPFPIANFALVNKTTDPLNWWRLPPPRQDEALVTSDAMHQTHCVQGLWKFMHRHEWDNAKTEEKEIFHAMHNRHCSAYLLSILKCRADVTPVVFQHDDSGFGVWKTRDAPRRCRNFDAMHEWENRERICPEVCTEENKGKSPVCCSDLS